MRDISENNEWWPLIEEYDPGVDKNTWLYLLKDSTVFNEKSLIMLAEFFLYGGIATCAQLAERYGRKYNYYLSNSVYLAERVAKKTSCPVYTKDQNAKWWPVLYVGKNASKEEQGTYIWKIREELFEALKEFGIEKYLPDKSEKGVLGVFDSWEIIDYDTAIKHCDKSFFEHNGSGIPKGICWFFEADELNEGEKRELELLYKGDTHSAKIVNDSTDSRRVRIFWSGYLGNIFRSFKGEDTIAEFKRVDRDKYAVTLRKGENAMSI